MKKLVLLILIVPTLAIAQIDVPDRGFISTTPAATWEEGLISGNGTMGANVFARPLDETVIFTHERMFLPMGSPTMPPDQSARLFEIRDLLDKGLYRQATELQFELSGQESFMYPDPFVPCFDMGITMNTDYEIRDYVRSTNFETGETLVQWSDKNGTYERKLFVSRADGIAVMKISGSKKGMINCEIRLKQRIPSDKLNYKYVGGTARRFASHVKDVKVGLEGNVLTYEHSFSQAYPGSVQKLEGAACIVQTGGHAGVERGTVILNNADEVLILIDLELAYDPDDSNTERLKQKLQDYTPDYTALLKKHVAIHSEMFNRMKLDLGGGDDHLKTTEELLELSTMENINKALIEKEFDAARYNIISCTGELPPTLQGVWAGSFVPDWASDFTHNGNVPSAIASTLKGNYPELMHAYTGYMESVVPWMEINAQHLFGCRGIVLPSRSTTNAYNNALAPRFAGGFWVGGASWAAHFFYDYYQYTGDIDFLREHAVPFMEKCAIFFEDFLYEGPDGKFIFSPTQSPENTPKNANSQGSFNATMDVAVAKELFTNLIKASNLLKVNQDKISLWEDMLTKMPDYMINEDGIIKEWLTPRLDNNDDHRHSSQLYPLYDDFPKEIAESPELQEAFKKSIIYKLDKHWRGKRSGFMSFGLVQLGQTAASLGEGEIVYECLQHLVNRFWLSNMASMHNAKTLFNMDISGGQPDVIIKALVFSEMGYIKLLPAVPKAWDKGTIEGVLCRGQIEVESLEWDKDGLKASLISGKDQSVTVEAFGKTKKVKLKKGEVYELSMSK